MKSRSKKKRGRKRKGTIEGKGIVKGKGKGKVNVEVKGKGNSQSFSIETNTLGGRNFRNCHPLFTSVTLFGPIQKLYWRGPVNFPIVTPFINAR